MTTEYYESDFPNTNPNCNGQPAVLKVEISDTTVRLTVTGSQGSNMAGAGSTVILSDTEVPRQLYESTRSTFLTGMHRIH